MRTIFTILTVLFGLCTVLTSALPSRADHVTFNWRAVNTLQQLASSGTINCKRVTLSAHAAGGATGRERVAVTIITKVNPTSLQLMAAMTQTIPTATITYYTKQSGKRDTVASRIELAVGSVTSESSGSGKGALMTIKFTFLRMTYVPVKAGATVQDDWVSSP